MLKTLQPVNIGKQGGGGLFRLSGLILFAALLVAVPAKADLVSYADGAAAADAGLVELFTVTIAGNTRYPVVAAADVPVGLTLHGLVDESRSDSRVLGTGTVTWNWWNLWSFDLQDLGDLEAADLLGYAISGVSYSGNDLHNGQIDVTANGGSFVLYTWNNTTHFAGFQTGANEGQTDFTFTVTYYGSAEVPEPATLAVLGLGLAGLGIARRRMKK